MSSNSFNICPRCGNSNMLNAKYCSRCGGELKLPEEPIVCHNCRTRNTPMANFCRNCGAELKVGYATKICTRCGSEVPAEQNVCTCGYMFAQNAYATPIPVRADGTVNTGVTATNTAADTAEESTAKDKKGKKAKDKANKESKVSKGKDNKVYSHKGGRAFAIVAMILLLVFAYFIAAPTKLRPSFLSNFDKGMSSYETVQQEQGDGAGEGSGSEGTEQDEHALATQEETANDGAEQETPSEGDGQGTPESGEQQEAATAPEAKNYYGYDVVFMFVKAFMGGGSFGDIIANNGGMAMALVAVVTIIFAIAVLVHFIVCLVRAIKPRRSKKPNWCFLALAALTTVVVGLIALFNFISVGNAFFAKIAAVFKLAEGWSLGYVLYAIPAYFWFFFLYSLIAKARALKEQTIAPVAEEQAA